MYSSADQTTGKHLASGKHAATRKKKEKEKEEDQEGESDGLTHNGLAVHQVNINTPSHELNFTSNCSLRSKRATLRKGETERERKRETRVRTGHLNCSCMREN